MSVNDTYKRDKAVIKLLMSAPANKIGIWYVLIGSVFSLVLIIAELADGKDNLTPMSLMLLGFMNMLGIILSLSGSTVYTGEKNSAQAREMSKGAYNQLPTFLCMPVRRESLYRWQFECIMLFVVISSVNALVIAIYCLMSGTGIDLDVIMTLLNMFSVTLSCFLLTYGVVFNSKKFKLFLNVFYIASLIMMCVGDIAFVLIRLFAGEFGETDLFWFAPVHGGEIIIIAVSLLFPVIVCLMYKNIILKRMGGGWYE